MPAIRDLAGQRFGSLVAKGFIGFNTHRKAMWLCRCDCGLEVLLVGGNLTSGDAKTCGCVGRKAAAERARIRNQKHGHSIRGTFSGEYTSWAGMHRRCKYPNTHSYDRYGGRGIKVCERWRSFENFLADMGSKPTSKHSIDRIDANGNYEPENCRWLTNKEQQRNRNNHRFVEVDGRSIPLIVACEEYGAEYNLVRDRLQDGWSLERALHTPKRVWLHRVGSA